MVPTKCNYPWDMAFRWIGRGAAGDNLMELVNVKYIGSRLDTNSVAFTQLLQCNSVVQKSHGYVATVYNFCPRVNSIFPYKTCYLCLNYKKAK